MPKPIGSLLAALLLAGCGVAPATTPPANSAPATSAPSTSAPATSAPPTTSASSSSAAKKVIEITLKAGKVDPNGERVTLPKGTVLELVITSDHADEVHVHGYDLEIPVTAGATVTKDLTLDQIGRFEVESHEPSLTILQLVVS
jgi:hypothetical protein